MTEDQAFAEAAKREKHKSKHMTHKRWSAVETEQGWRVALVDVASAVEPPQITLEGVAIAVSLFGVAATAQALSMLAKRGAS